MKIHFVWLGKYQGPHCTATPIEVQKACPDDEVWLWVLKGNAGEFTAPLKGTDVQLMLLDSSQGPLGAQNWVEDAFSVMNALMTYKAFVAAKDLAVLMILFKYGGLYLDTTCLIATDDELAKYKGKTGGKAQSLPVAVKALAKSGPLMPLVTDDKIPYQAGCYTEKAVLVGYDNTAEGEFKVHDMPQIDVWGYYAPSMNKMFQKSVEAYVKRAQVIGLEKDSDNKVGKKELEGPKRDELIGNLIINSVYDGLAAMNNGVKPDAVKKMCWRTTPFTDRPANLPPAADANAKIKADIVPELGIIKQYKGSWRKK